MISQMYLWPERFDLHYIRKSAKDEVSTSFIKLAAVTAMAGSGVYIAAVKGMGGGGGGKARGGWKGEWDKEGEKSRKENRQTKRKQISKNTKQTNNKQNRQIKKNTPGGNVTGVNVTWSECHLHASALCVRKKQKMKNTS